jgi:uncharacterized protein (TIGR02391 family)
MSEKKSLKMSFDPNTIKHLGVNMYSTMPSALAELIANAYDADASIVKVSLLDNAQGKSVEVIDDGTGMSFDEINDCFLKVGRNRRNEGQEWSPSGRRRATGKKGLGKLAFFGITNKIIVNTSKAGENYQTTFSMDWDELTDQQASEYEPKFSIETAGTAQHWTKVSLVQIKRKSAFDGTGLAISIAKLFHCLDSEFRVLIFLNGSEVAEATNNLKYSDLRVEAKWEFPEYAEALDVEYQHASEISGVIISNETPLKPGIRGITLFANGRLVNAAEFFDAAESSHAFSYLTGWLNVNFVDEWKPDAIATDRQSLRWHLDGPSALRAFLTACMTALEKSRREERKKVRRKKTRERTGIDIEQWFSRLPGDIQKKVESIVETVAESEMAQASEESALSMLNELVPEYPYYHWRHLHNSIKAVSGDDYKKKDYYRAAQEAAKRFINDVQKKSQAKDKKGKLLDGKVLMDHSFGPNGCLALTNCSNVSEQNLETGQLSLSIGLVSGFRNPTHHKNKCDLHPDFFSDKDCLDILSLTSYLLTKLDSAKKKK